MFEGIVGTIPYSAQKKGELLWLINKLKDPKIIVEVGVMHGGTCAIFKKCFPKAQVIGIDNKDTHVGLKEMRKKYNYELIVGDSTSKSTIEILREMTHHKKIDFIFIDGNHTYEGVKKDWITYKKLSNTVGFHDVAEAKQNEGVPKLWKEIKREHNTEEIIEPEKGGKVTWAGIGLVYL